MYRVREKMEEKRFPFFFFFFFFSYLDRFLSSEEFTRRIFRRSWNGTAEESFAQHSAERRRKFVSTVALNLRAAYEIFIILNMELCPGNSSLSIRSADQVCLNDDPKSLSKFLEESRKLETNVNAKFKKETNDLRITTIFYFLGTGDHFIPRDVR